MLLGCLGVVIVLSLAALVHLAFFWKINWIRDLTHLTRPKKGGNYLGPKARKVGKLPPVYPNGWFALAESAQIKRGEVRHIAALGENFAVFRTEKGIISILDAFCPHLGANMAEGGRVKGECLECPFHSWVFRGDNGVCESIPYAKKVPSVARTRVWRSCEVNQLIFVWYHAELAEPTWEPQPHPKISSGVWRNQGRNEFLINCHIQDIPENGADLAHLNAVHGPAMLLGGVGPWFARHSWTNAAWSPLWSNGSERSGDVELSANETIETIRTSKNGADRVAIVDDNDNDNEDLYSDTKCQKHELQSEFPDQKHVACMRLSHKMTFLRRFDVLRVNVDVRQIGPGYVELLLTTARGATILILQTVTPVAPMVQRVLHLVFARPIIAPLTSLVFLGECLMFERDVAVWNHKRFEHRPVLVREDRTILAYRRWYSQFYSEHSPSYREAMESLQW